MAGDRTTCFGAVEKATTTRWREANDAIPNNTMTKELVDRYIKDIVPERKLSRKRRFVDERRVVGMSEGLGCVCVCVCVCALRRYPYRCRCRCRCRCCPVRSFFLGDATRTLSSIHPSIHPPIHPSVNQSTEPSQTEPNQTTSQHIIDHEKEQEGAQRQRRTRQPSAWTAKCVLRINI